MIQQVQDTPKTNNEAIEELEDRIVDWYKSITT